MKHATRRFTLIELLITIAIIAILAGLLLPALKKAKDTADSTTCMNNMKNIGVACYQYVGDYNDYLPTGSYYEMLSNCLVIWSTTLSWYLYPNTKKDWYIYFCRMNHKFTKTSLPSTWLVAEAGTLRGTYSFYNMSYGINPYVAGYYGNWNFHRKVTSIKNQRAFLVSESDYSQSALRTWTLGDDGYFIGPWHNGRSNMLFLDSSVSSIKTSTIGTKITNPQLFSPSF